MTGLGLEEGRIAQARRMTAVGMGPVEHIPRCQHIAEVGGWEDTVQEEQRILRVEEGMQDRQVGRIQVRPIRMVAVGTRW